MTTTPDVDLRPYSPEMVCRNLHRVRNLLTVAPRLRSTEEQVIALARARQGLAASIDQLDQLIADAQAIPHPIEDRLTEPRQTDRIGEAP